MEASDEKRRPEENRRLLPHASEEAVFSGFMHVSEPDRYVRKSYACNGAEKTHNFFHVVIVCFNMTIQWSVFEDIL